MSKKMIIKGVGQLLAKRAKADGKGAEIVTLGTLQDLKIDMNVEIDDVFGGDGLFAIDTLVKSKSIEVTATDVKFDLATMELLMGSTLEENVTDSLWVLNEQQTLPSTPDAGATTVSTTVDFGTTLFGDGNFSVRLKDDNSLLTKITYSTTVAPTETQFAVDTTGKVYLHESHAGADIVVNYQRTETVDVVNMLADEVPFPVHVIHHGSFQQKDGTFQGLETELFQCRAKGQFTINAARATAAAPAVTLKVIDPERADGKIGSIKRYSASARV